MHPRPQLALQVWSCTNDFCSKRIHLVGTLSIFLAHLALADLVSWNYNAHALNQRVHATPESSRRCKVSVIAEATASMADAVNPKRLLPYDDNFFPQTSKAIERRPETRKSGNPFHAVNIIPHGDQVRFVFYRLTVS